MSTLRQHSYALVFALATVAGAGSGCSGCKGLGGGGVPKDDLVLAPKEAEILFSANLGRVRNTTMWRKLLDLRDNDAGMKKDYEDFVKKCAFDPMQQLESVFAAFPQGASDSKEFVLIVRGPFNEQKLVECATEQAKKDGADLTISEYGGKKVYTNTRSAQGYAVFLDAKTVALGGKEWIKKTIDLASGRKNDKTAEGQAEQPKSVRDNPEMMAVHKRVRTTDGMWGVGLVPQTMRDSLKDDPNLSVAATMKQVFGSVDFANGIVADLNVDLASNQDATDLTTKIQGQLADVRKNPQFMMAGIGTFLDNVKIEARLATFHVGVTFNQPQVDDLINRMKGLLASLRGGLTGGIAPPMPSAPDPVTPPPTTP